MQDKRSPLRHFELTWLDLPHALLSTIVKHGNKRVTGQEVANLAHLSLADTFFEGQVIQQTNVIAALLFLQG